MIEVRPGTLLLVIDQSITGWAETYYDRKRYPLLDAALTLHLVQDDGELKPLWNRVFKTAKGAFGAAGLGQLRKHLAARPQSAVDVRTVDPGPGVPNFKAGPCRWCSTTLPANAGVLVGRGPDAEVEHHKACPAQLAAPGTPCALCAVPVAPETARLVMVREGTGRREVRHTGRCEGQLSNEEHEQQRAEHRAAEAERRAAEKAAEEKRAKQREAAKARRQAAAQEKERLEREGAEATRRRVESLEVAEALERKELYDKGLDPYGRRMRLVEVCVRLSDGEPARWWEVTEYGGRGDDYDEDGERSPYYVLADARSVYQQYTYQSDRPSRRSSWTPRTTDTGPCPAGGEQHCDNCGTTVSVGGWMVASLGLACDVDCYTAMSDDRGLHARQYHRS
ncbi:hypothetical protein ACWDXD_24925 [Streptomyces sp. NPDC003314]